MTKRYAKFIDGFDIVVRFGRAISANKAQQKCVGSKCDIWITGQFRAPEYNKNKENFTTGKYKDTRILVNRCRGNIAMKNWKLEDHLPEGMPQNFMYTDEELVSIMKKEFGKDLLDTNVLRPSAGFISILWFIDKIKTYKSLHLIGFDFFTKQTNVKPVDKRGFRSNCKPHSWHLPVYLLNKPAHDSDMELNYIKKLVARRFLIWYILSDLNKNIIEYKGWMKGEKIISSVPRKTKTSKI